MWTSSTDSQWSELLVEMNNLFHQAVGQVQTGELSIHKWSIVCMFYGKLFFSLKAVIDHYLFIRCVFLQSLTFPLLFVFSSLCFCFAFVIWCELRFTVILWSCFSWFTRQLFVNYLILQLLLLFFFQLDKMWELYITTCMELLTDSSLEQAKEVST